MSAIFKFSSELNKEKSTSSFIPYNSHITKSIVKLVSGDYVQVLKMQGAAHESADISDINSWHHQLNNFMRNIASPHIALWTHVIRREYNEYPGGELPPGFCHDFNEKYRQYFSKEKKLINELYLSIVYRPQPNKVAKLFDKLTSNKKEELKQQQLDAIQAIEDVTGIALATLDRYEPELLGCYDHNGLAFSEVLEFFAFLINGEWRRFPLPRSEIRDILATSRPFFGKGGLMSLKTPTDNKYCSIITIQEYPPKTHPGLLNELLCLPCEFVISQSFTFLSKPTAIKKMAEQQSRLINAGDVATSQIDEIDDALDDITSNRFVLGEHNLSLMIHCDNTKELNEFVNAAGAALSDSGMKWVREEMGVAGAYWAQLPGNFDYRVRKANITSLNFAGFSSLHNYPIGRIRGNQWGDAVTVFKTTSGAPYYYNFHKGEDGADAKKAAKLDPDHKDPANTVVIGKTGTGKTVLEMIMILMAQKFNQPENGKKLTTIIFDKDLGASIGVRAMGGRYYPIKNGLPTGFNPFQLEPTPNNITFLVKLVRQLVKHEGFPLLPSEEQKIAEVVDGVMAASKSKRRLGAMLEFLNPEEANGLHTRLSKWCRGGALGWLFDNAEDTLIVDDCPIVGFDVTEFIDNDETRTPTVMYLFHRIESLIDGRRIPIFMDEFWKLLDDEAFEDLAKNKLVTIRKQDGFLVMFTQHPQQVLKSPIAFAIVGQTSNKIFLPNPEADYDDYVNGFKCTEAEYEIIKNLGEKSRRFLLKQGHNSVVVELNLKGFEDELAVMSGNTGTALLVEEIIKEHGDDPATWLPIFHKLRKGA